MHYYQYLSTPINEHLEGVLPDYIVYIMENALQYRWIQGISGPSFSFIAIEAEVDDACAVELKLKYNCGPTFLEERPQFKILAYSKSTESTCYLP